MKLKDIRENADITQTELSELSGVTQATICRIESGEIKTPRLNVVKKLAAALNMTIDELVSDVTDKDLFHFIQRVKYNSHDLGELGKFIRIRYILNILKDYEVRRKK